MTEEPRHNVLLVDDNEANIDVLLETLGNAYSVRVAMDGKAALRAVSEEKPDLILLDVMMPGMDGYDVCRELKKNHATKEIPIIFVTALDQVGDEALGFEVGAVDYITKPIQPEIVRARVETHLELKRSRAMLVRQNESLKENARLREEMEQVFRHDLKSPLTVVIQAPELLAENEKFTSDEIEMLGMIKKAGFRIMDMINNSLDLVRMERGEYEVRAVAVDMLALTKTVSAELRQGASDKDVTISVRIDGRKSEQGDALAIQGEESLFYSLLCNLVKNAVEASPRGETVLMSLSSATPPTVSIHNQGAIPEKIRERFFEKFVTCGKTQGTGLGTYSAKIMADTLGCPLTMATSEREGTVITFSGQLSEPEGTGITEIQTEKDTESPCKTLPGPVREISRQSTILIVDDFAASRRLLKSILRQNGFRNIIEAQHGQVAMEHLRSQEVGLIICDWDMPVMDGMELLREVRADIDLRPLPFIMVTGETHAKRVAEAVHAGVTNYMVKPYVPDNLLRVIKALMSVVPTRPR